MIKISMNICYFIDIIQLGLSYLILILFFAAANDLRPIIMYVTITSMQRKDTLDMVIYSKMLIAH